MATLNESAIRRLIQDEVRYAVASEVKNKMTPNFIEVMCRQLIFQSQLNSAIQSQLPNALQQNSSIISQFVQTHLPSVLCQQHYFQSGINQQKALFDDAIAKQATAYQQQQQLLISRLSQETDTLISKTIGDIANSQFMMSKLKDSISADVNDRFNTETQKMHSEIKEIKNNVVNGYVYSGIFGAGIACSVMGLTKYFGI